MEKYEQCAVLTGDLIKSRQASPQQRAETLETIALLARKGQEPFHLVLYGPEVFRGDSWQLLIAPSVRALHLACFIRAGLRNRSLLDTRIGIGIGEARLEEKGLGTSDGTAFRLSGSAIDGLKRGETLACRLEEALTVHQSIPRLLDASLTFSARLMDEWSHLEAFSVEHALMGQTHAQIAAVWPGGATSQQNVTATLKRAGWPPLQKFLEAFQYLWTK